MRVVAPAKGGASLRPVALVVAAAALGCVAFVCLFAATQEEVLWRRTEEVVAQYAAGEWDPEETGVPVEVQAVPADPGNPFWQATEGSSFPSAAVSVALRHCAAQGLPAESQVARARLGDGAVVLLRRDAGDGTAELLVADVGAALRALRDTAGQLLAVSAVFVATLGALAWWALRKVAEAQARAADLFANAAHELRTPLSIAGGHVAALREGLCGQEEALAVVDGELGRIGALVDDILALSKADAGAVLPELRPLDVREELYDALGLLAPEAAASGVALVPSMPERLPLGADPRLLFSVLTNVLRNAVRHARTAVEVSARVEGARVVVSVRDDGEEPAEEDLRRAFDRFHAGSDGSTGIGMAVVKEYTELLGGDVRIRRDGDRTECRIVL